MVILQNSAQPFLWFWKNWTGLTRVIEAKDKNPEQYPDWEYEKE